MGLNMYPVVDLYGGRQQAYSWRDIDQVGFTVRPYEQRAGHAAHTTSCPILSGRHRPPSLHRHHLHQQQLKQ